MNWWSLTGAVLLLGAALAHSLVGEKMVLRRLYRRGGERAEEGRRSSDEAGTRRAVRLTWHSLSLCLVGFAMLLLTSGIDHRAVGTGWNALAPVIAATFAALTALSLFVSRGRHVGWMWYAAAAVAAWLSIG
jgi:hypothetical protein